MSLIYSVTEEFHTGLHSSNCHYSPTANVHYQYSSFLSGLKVLFFLVVRAYTYAEMIWSANLAILWLLLNVLSIAISTFVVHPRVCPILFFFCVPYQLFRLALGCTELRFGCCYLLGMLWRIFRSRLIILGLFGIEVRDLPSS